jgi:hypothetical protein
VARSAPQTTPSARPVERLARPTSTGQAKARAKARKAKAPKVVRPPLRDRLLHRLASIDLRPRTVAAKVPFVVVIIGSLGGGLGVTLWLSTDSAERSYQLGHARQANQMLQQQKEALERDVLAAQAAPSLAEAARGLGMIPTRDTPHLIPDAGGNWVVVGTPKPAEGVAPPPLNTKLPDQDAAPRPSLPVNSAEVPVLVSPDSGVPTVPATGPEVLVRGPDGVATGTQHWPAGAVPPDPGMADSPVAGPSPEPLPAPESPPAAAPGPSPEPLPAPESPPAAAPGPSPEPLPAPELPPVIAPGAPR